jgi:hypothetical protein
LLLLKYSNLLIILNRLAFTKGVRKGLRGV